MILSKKHETKIDLLHSFEGITVQSRNEKGEYEDRYIKPYNVQRIAWMVKLPYVVVSDYLGIDDGSKWKD
jgi:hypothetical protein